MGNLDSSWANSFQEGCVILGKNYEKFSCNDFKNINDLEILSQTVSSNHKGLFLVCGLVYHANLYVDKRWESDEIHYKIWNHFQSYSVEKLILLCAQFGIKRHVDMVEWLSDTIPDHFTLSQTENFIKSDWINFSNLHDIEKKYIHQLIQAAVKSKTEMEIAISLILEDANIRASVTCAYYLIVLMRKYYPNILENEEKSFSILQKSPQVVKLSSIFEDMDFEKALLAVWNELHEAPVKIEVDMTCTLNDPGSSIDAFIRYIRNCHDSNNSCSMHSKVSNSGKTYYAPLIAVIQSSGYGKTRLVMESCGAFCFFFVCLRAPNSTGSPPRVDSIANFVMGCKTELDFVKLIYRFIQYMHFLCLKKSFINDKGELEVLYDEIRAYLSLQLKDGSVNEFWDKVLADVEFSEICVAEGPLEYVALGKDYLEKIKKICPKYGSCPILLVFDEASSLFGSDSRGPDSTMKTNSFIYFRRAMSYFNHCGLMVVVMDTLSRISNYLPSSRMDASERIAKKGYDLYPPWICIDTMGCLNVPLRLEEYVEYSNPIDDMKFGQVEFRPFQLVSESRPIFSGFLSKLKCGSILELWDSVFSLADVKLSGGITSKQFSKQITDLKEIETRYLALLSIRLSVTPLNFQVQEKMVSHYMATLLAISEDRESLLVQYAEEPIIGEAAASILNTADNWSSAIDIMLKQYSAGYLAFGQTRGDIGELVCCLILTLAYDCAAQSSFNNISITEESMQIDDNLKNTLIYSRPITVYQFLNTILPEGRANKILMDSKLNSPLVYWLMNGFVSFTQFQQAENNVSILHAKNLFSRRIAVITKPCNKGYDIVIWVRLPDWRLESGLIVKSRYTCIFIECKNQKGRLNNLSGIMENLEKNGNTHLTNESNLDDRDSFKFAVPNSDQSEQGLLEWIENCKDDVLNSLIKQTGVDVGDDIDGKRYNTFKALMNLTTPSINILFNAGTEISDSQLKEIGEIEYSKTCLKAIMNGIHRETFGSFIDDERLSVIQEMVRQTPLVTEMVDHMEIDLRLSKEVVSKRLKSMFLVKNGLDIDDVVLLKRNLTQSEESFKGRE